MTLRTLTRPSLTSRAPPVGHKVDNDFELGIPKQRGATRRCSGSSIRRAGHSRGTTTISGYGKESSSRSNLSGGTHSLPSRSCPRTAP